MGILSYPQDIRDAILEVSQYPEIIVLLSKQSVFNEEVIEELSWNYPKMVQDAVQRYSDGIFLRLFM